MGYLVFRKWYFKDATTHWEAREMLSKAEKAGVDKYHFQGEWTKEEEHVGFIGAVKKQLTGK